MRRRFVSLAAITLSSLLAACVASPDDAARLSAEHPLDQRSSHGLVEATVSLDGPELNRGPNDLSVALRAAEGAAQARLVSVEAAMAAHGHRASPTEIVSDGEAFHVVGLDLFMSGRWQISLGVEVDASSDLVEFALDVP